MTLAAKFSAWLKGVDAKPQESQILAGAPGTAPPPGRPNPLTGLRDAVIRGWFNQQTGELFTGFPVGPDDVVADIGCGHGGHAKFCATRGAKVLLVDVNPARVAEAAALIAALPNPPATERYVTTGDLSPLKDGVASRIICTEVIEHVDSPAALMADLARIGKPGALYLLTCPDPGAEAIQQRVAGPDYFAKPNHVRILQHADFARFVEEAGLIVEARHSHGFFWSMWLTLFWACDYSFQAAEEAGFQEPHHPLLDHWTWTWQTLLDQPKGVMVKQALDDLMPKSQVIIARKPNTIATS